MRISPPSTRASYSTDFQIAHPSFMASSIWAAVLTLAVILGSLALSCVAPLSALAVALSATLELRASLGVMTLVWFVNQVIGFTLFHFPQTADTIGRGLASGLAALLIVVVARAITRRASSWSGWLRLCVALVATIAVYEVALFAAAMILGGRDMFTLPIVSQVALINAAWLLAIVVLNEIVAAVCKPWLGRMPMVVRSAGFF
jgi:hypothetical protein